ncbi:crossover junction endonuclease MUS81-like [Lineus longissimus]|uniref:crossover junction endonuclease MUS81-like n=1 Tax=Lineus longissimus TaxID=88925 RepID=UPI002B4FA89F
MAAPILLGKRKKKKAGCANPMFIQWLTEWRDEANEKGWKSAFNYNKAINSLKKYPLMIPTGKECKFLEHIGDKTCVMLDKKLAEYKLMHGGQLPAPVMDDEPEIVTPVKRKKTAKKATEPGTSVNPALILPLPDPQFAHLTIPPPPDDGLGMTPGSVSKKKTPGKDKEYIPAYKSGPYALLITLYKNQQLAHSRGYMLKQELIEDAQPLSEKSLTVPDPGCRYTAWSSMGMLVKKGFIMKESSPAKYTITDAGCELAHKILAAEQLQGGVTNRVENVPQFTLRAASPVKKRTPAAAAAGAALKRNPATPTGAAALKKNPKKKPPPAMDIGYLSPDEGAGFGGYGAHSLSDNGDDIPLHLDSPDGLPNVENPDMSLCAVSGLQFTYIDDAGREVQRKDQACVLVDEEISIGLLIRCSYYDLLVSPLRYKLDNARSREGSNVYAYLHHEDAADCSTIKKALPKPSAMTADKSKQDIASMASASFTKADVLPPAKKPAKKKNVPSATITTAAQNDIKEIINPPAPKSQFLPAFPKKPALAVSAAGSSQRSTGQDSQSSVNSVDSIASSVVPKFTLHPGEFEVVLCVDNREHFGAGCSKKNLLPELMKNGVSCDVRNLTVGDFAWIAREKLEIDPNQLRAPQCKELILDFVVERKRMDDLSGSIKDGRFKEQKFRLRQCGLKKPIYLVEKYGSGQNFGLPQDTLDQAIANTQIIDGFFVKYTNNQKESVAYLTIMTRFLQKCITRKTLVACSKDELDDSDLDITAPQLQLMTFDEFNKSSVKTRALTVKEHFGKHLMRINKMSQDKALAVLAKYNTPQSLFAAYDQCLSNQERDNLLANLKFGAGSRSFGPALSKVVAQLYTTNGPLPS